MVQCGVGAVVQDGVEAVEQYGVEAVVHGGAERCGMAMDKMRRDKMYSIDYKMFQLK